jgi:hypothetical protein
MAFPDGVLQTIFQMAMPRGRLTPSRWDSVDLIARTL